MTNEDLESIAKKWIGAFREHNIEKLMALYHNNAKHYSPRLEEERPESNGWLIGKEKLREWWQRNFDELPGLSYELKQLTFDRPEIYMKYIRTVPGKPDKEVWEYFKIEDGLIVESRVLRSWIL